MLIYPMIKRPFWSSPKFGSSVSRSVSIEVSKLHGEAMSADNDAIENEIPRIKEIIRSYNPQNFWNADEFGLFTVSREHGASQK